MQKSTWINDGQGQYYMSADGTPAKGWMTFPEGRYYLDASTGKMATDWRDLTEPGISSTRRARWLQAGGM